MIDVYEQELSFTAEEWESLAPKAIAAWPGKTIFPLACVFTEDSTAIGIEAGSLSVGFMYGDAASFASNSITIWQPYVLTDEALVNRQRTFANNRIQAFDSESLSVSTVGQPLLIGSKGSSATYGGTMIFKVVYVVL